MIMNLLAKILNRGACILIPILLTGCLPGPHTTPRSAEVWGRVLDARTHAPIQNAAVYLSASPHYTTYTDADGYFHLKATRNFHFAYTGGSGLPDSKDDAAAISHTNYISYGFVTDMVGSNNVGNIYLEPKH